MRIRTVALLVVVSLWAIPSARAQSDTERALGELYRTFSAVESPEAPLELRSNDGYLTFIGAPPQTTFETETSKNKVLGFSAGNVAIDFVRTHGPAFGGAPGASYAVKNVQTNNGIESVRLRQSYAGLPVFGGEMVVQVGPEGGVQSVMSDIMRDATQLENGEVPTTPTLTAAQASEKALQYVANLKDVSSTSLNASAPELQIFKPSILGLDGATRLVWVTDVRGDVGAEPIGERVFVDGLSGAVAFNYALVHSGLDIQIYDANHTFSQGTLVREDGDAQPTGIKDADDAFDYLSATYKFYNDQHQRDGIDDEGGTLVAIVRYGQNYANANWLGGGLDFMLFGDGFVIEDVTGHELTHGVTEYTSDLIYFGESGAINESFSDMWGEWIDLLNSSARDTPEVRWRQGEDFPADLGALYGIEPGKGIRNMKNPPEFSWFPFDSPRELRMPDRYNHPDFYRGFDDNGGVHINSGVGNKLCYLLTDGDTFNGQVVTGLGIPLASDLFYATQFILTPGSGYHDLYAALGQASGELNLTRGQRVNILNATKAVEIAVSNDSGRLRGFRSLPAMTSQGQPVVVLGLQKPSGSAFSILSLVRKEGSFPTSETDGTTLPVASLNSSGMYVDGLDGSLQAGKQYFYSVFWDSSLTFPGTSYARATAGDDVPDFKTEIFIKSDNDPFDIEFTQVLFSPSVDPRAAEASGQPSDYVNYTNYATTVKRNISALPVPRQGAITLPMTDDGVLSNLQFSSPVPFFGRNMTTLALSANGFITFGTTCEFCSSNFPSLNSHANDPRISFLFGDLDPGAGGTVWATTLPDREVVTFENVPEHIFSPSGAPKGNTVQVELFYSGHIRMTYLEVGVETAIVGLSDGNGAPLDPADALPGSPSELKETDFSNIAAGDPNTVTLWPPVPLQFAVAGETVEFTVKTNSPNGVPAIVATWDRAGVAPLTDNRDGTGSFRWRPTTSTLGTTTVNIVATFGGEAASMTVPITVSDPNVRPEARTLLLYAGEDGEDPSESRDVDVNNALRAEYTYFHPDATARPTVAAEGQSEITWYKNGTAVAALANSLTVPPSATRIGDRWSFAVRPFTVAGIAGPVATSPVVTVGGNPVITGVFPGEGPMAGGTTVRITGRRLSGPINVTFGGIRALNVISRGDEEIEVVTPLYREGTVDIEVSAIAGTTLIEDGYRYRSDSESLARADVNKDGVVDAVDVRLVANAILAESNEPKTADANVDGKVNSTDLQFVVNAALVR